MRAVGRLVQEMCEETRAGWSWKVMLSQVEAPGWLAFHGPKGTRSAVDEMTSPGNDDPRLELWPSGGAAVPLIAVPVTANRHFRDDVSRVFRQPVDPREGWLLFLALLHALDEAARARPRVPAVGDTLGWSGAPTLSAWASAMTLGDLESALLRARP